MMQTDGTVSRTYFETHSWIKFQEDYRKLDYKTWILLGEAQSKCEHISGVPLLPGVAEGLHQLYLAKGVLASTAIEGNTLTEDEVRLRIQGRLKLSPSREYLGQEIDNVLEACNGIADKVFSGQSAILTVEDIREFNRLVLRDLPLSEGVIPGEIRAYGVAVGQYRGAPAEDCEFLLTQFCEWLSNSAPPDAHLKVLYGILRAIVAHVHFAWIHPFGDGNGRTARLIEFHVLLSSGVPSAAAHLLSNHYNQTRTEYYRQLNMTSRSGGDLSPFIRYAVQGLVDGLRDQLSIVNTQQLVVHWRDYVHASFRNKSTKAKVRQRSLVLALAERQDATNPVPVSEIRYVSPEIAEAYAGKTDKTVQRDINELERMNLILRTPQGVTANIGLMLAFQPATRSEDVD